jgi:hypothetical protein
MTTNHDVEKPRRETPSRNPGVKPCREVHALVVTRSPSITGQVAATDGVASE